MTTRSASTVRKRDLAQLTRAYPYLQGYAALPFLLVVLATLLINGGVVTGAWSWLAAIGSVLVASHASNVIRRWYERNFGLVRPAGARGWQPFITYVGLMLLGLVIVPALLSSLARVPAEFFDGKVIAWPYAVLGILLVGQAFILRPYLSFNAVFGALLAALALVPLGEWLGLAGNVHPFRGAAGLAFMTVGLIGYAFTTHATLVRELRRMQAELGAAPTALEAGPTECHEDQP